MYYRLGFQSTIADDSPIYCVCYTDGTQSCGHGKDVSTCGILASDGTFSLSSVSQGHLRPNGCCTTDVYKSNANAVVSSGWCGILFYSKCLLCYP